jgi:hypothetical protein
MSTLRDAERDGGNERFTWKGVQIPCVASSEVRTTLVDTLGNAVDVDFTLFVRIVHLLTADSTIFTADDTIWDASNDGKPPPIAGKEIVFRGRTYRVLSAKLSGCRSHYALQIGDPHNAR